MSAQKNPLGPTGDTVRHNVRRIREARGLTYAELSRRLKAVGREIPTLGLSRVEEGKRRVDADDLVALAMVFGVSPVALLLPHDSDQAAEGRVSVLPGHSTPWRAAWRWMLGEHPYEEPFTDEGGPERKGQIPTEWIRRFIKENRPHEDVRPAREAMRFLSDRLDGRWRVKIWNDGRGKASYKLSEFYLPPADEDDEPWFDEEDEDE
jgi:transcriptional regulator with XRE-family HTH domain